ncbi:hypothetical protein RRG08_015456 [Elysia crispata]|uniref:Uncharacterized protein n=1 Tax=Elysia crispata TaxID=231223 RepID=A0AAE1CYT5_9GAST|nr:hypothetical protein RRG08_015456 [Elysia crispata]
MMTDRALSHIKLSLAHKGDAESRDCINTKNSTPLIPLVYSHLRRSMVGQAMGPYFQLCVGLQIEKRCVNRNKLFGEKYFRAKDDTISNSSDVLKGRETIDDLCCVLQISLGRVGPGSKESTSSRFNIIHNIIHTEGATMQQKLLSFLEVRAPSLSSFSSQSYSSSKGEMFYREQLRVTKALLIFVDVAQGVKQAPSDSCVYLNSQRQLNQQQKPSMTKDKEHFSFLPSSPRQAMQEDETCKKR